MQPKEMPADSVPLDREGDRPHPLQIELYKKSTPTQKLAVVARLNMTAIALRDSVLQRDYPAMSAPERAALLRRWWLTAQS